MPPPRRSPALDDTLIVGVVVGAFGLHGEMKVRVESEVPDRFGPQAKLLLWEHDTLKPVTLEGARPHKGQMLVKLSGIDTAEAAADMRGAEFRIPRSEAPRLPQGSYYLYELEGLEVLTEAGEVLGRVVEIWQPGSADIYVVAKPGCRRWMIPAVSDFVKRIDLKAGQMTVRVEDALQE